MISLLCFNVTVNSNQYKLEFDILGDTNVVYICIFELGLESPKCSCPHHLLRKAFCKHLSFVCKYVIMSNWHTVLSPTAPTIDYFSNIISGLPARMSDIGAKPEQIAQYMQKKNDGIHANNPSIKFITLLRKCKQIRNVECAICLESFDISSKLNICGTCENGVHVDCFKQWNKNQCVYCRNIDCKVIESQWGLMLTV